MRLFIGIPLSPEVVDALAGLSQSLRSTEDGFRWSSPQSWHITLQFLGETSETTYACLLAHLKEVSSPEFQVHIDGTGFFDRAGIFFAGVSDSPELAQLQKQIVAATVQCGFVAEDRPFHPHITLARAKGGARTRVLRQLKTKIKGNERFPAFTAREFLLYEAFLGSGGSRYEIRERFPLAVR
ncbi:RNA 2',3'-cyclic phosphodiesterase [Telmatobacter sp. DSM 110680]|uniref:RNA 2',3'-cyclic phosphodiesterase n=1 Tax=Telmatobacter sp. DSM 110680 TaxID=3036704 RepID=A0AAU7DLA3_9BACT